MASLFRKTVLILAFLGFHGPAAAETVYNSQMMSLQQHQISSPLQGNNDQVLEGCGPISAAMLLGYWQTERGKTGLLANDFTGRFHPQKAIRKLYRKLKTKKAPGAQNLQSYTLAKNYYNGLQDWVVGHGLNVQRMRRIKTWAAKKSTLKTQLAAGNPVVLLKWKERADGCLGEGSKGFNLYKNIANSHYYVAVGYHNDKVAVMPGWYHQERQNASGIRVHFSKNQTHNKNLKWAYTICTFDEIKKNSPTLFWLEEKN